MKVEAPFIHLIKLHTKYYLYDVNSKMIVNISNDCKRQIIRRCL